MGQKSSSIDINFSDEDAEQFQKNHEKLNDVSDTRFGKIEVFQNKKNQGLVFQLTRTFPNSDEFDEYLNDLKVRFSLKHPNVLQILGFKKQQYKELCGSSNVVTIFIEYHDNNLQLEIEERVVSSNFFNEQQIWMMLEGLLAGATFLQENNICHGDIRPLNIFLTVDMKTKIADNGFLNPIKNNYFKRLCGEVDVYLSPEQLQNFQNKETSPTFNVYKSDVFSLGMTLLYITNLINPLKICYDSQNPEILFNKVEELLQKIGYRYSQNLIETIRKMLIPDPNNRPSFKELLPLIGQQAQQQQQPAQQFAQFPQQKILYQPVQEIYNCQPIIEQIYQPPTQLNLIEQQNYYSANNGQPQQSNDLYQNNAFESSQQNFFDFQAQQQQQQQQQNQYPQYTYNYQQYNSTKSQALPILTNSLQYETQIQQQQSDAYQQPTYQFIGDNTYTIQPIKIIKNQPAQQNATAYKISAPDEQQYFSNNITPNKLKQQATPPNPTSNSNNAILLHQKIVKPTSYFQPVIQQLQQPQQQQYYSSSSLLPQQTHHIQLDNYQIPNNYANTTTLSNYANYQYSSSSQPYPQQQQNRDSQYQQYQQQDIINNYSSNNNNIINNNQSQNNYYSSLPLYDDSEIERKVQEAIKQTEETIKRNSQIPILDKKKKINSQF